MSKLGEFIRAGQVEESEDIGVFQIGKKGKRKLKKFLKKKVIRKRKKPTDGITLEDLREAKELLGGKGVTVTKDGMIVRRRRRRGISATELRGFKKVVRLLAMVGMVARGLSRRARPAFAPRRRLLIGDGLDEDTED